MSPVHHRSSSAASGLLNIKTTQSVEASAAAARPAQVMASQTAADNGDDEDEEDLVPSCAAGFRYGAQRPASSSSGGSATGVAFGRPTRSHSPALSSRLRGPCSICSFNICWKAISFCLFNTNGATKLNIAKDSIFYSNNGTSH